MEKGETLDFCTAAYQMNNSLGPFTTGWREHSLFPGLGSRKELWPLSTSSWSSQSKQFPLLWFLHLRACWGILGKVTSKGICRKGCVGMCTSPWSRHHAFQQGKHSIPQYSARLCVQWKLGRLMVTWSDPSLSLPALLSTTLPFSVAILASLLFLKRDKHALTSGPLDLSVPAT